MITEMAGLRARIAGAARAAAIAVACGAGIVPAAGPVLAQAQPGAVTIRQITVEGSTRIDPATIAAYSELSVGDTVSPSEINAAVGRIFATGLFETVEIIPAGDGLVISVVENPIINRVAFEGNELIPDEVLADAIRLQPRRPFDRGRAEADAQSIIEAYRAAGRFDASVRPVIIELPDNRVNVVFEIVEGEVLEIEQIVFLGNRRYTDRQLMDVIVSREAGLLSTFFTRDNYSTDRLRQDQEQLRQFYLSEGFADFDIASATAELNETRDGFILTFTVVEGDRYTFGDLSVSSRATGLSADQFDGLITARTGDTFSPDLIESTIQGMTDRAGDLGFAFTDVQPRVTRNAEARTIDVDFELREGERTFVERIDIVGNVETLDRVIRREFDIVEGDVYNARELAEAEDRIRALRFFNRVDVRTERGSQANQAVVRAEVEDGRTGSLDFGVTYSPSEGTGFAVSFAERNFLGRGQEISLSLNTSDDSRTTAFGFTEPRFLDRDLAVGFDIFDRQTSLSTADYQTSTLGFSPRVSFPVSERGRLSLGYRIAEEEIFGADDVNTVSQIIRDEQGDALSSSVTARYTYDRRNSRFAPTAGYIATLEGELAGLGGDVEYIRASARTRFHTGFRDDSIAAFIEFDVGAIEAPDGTRVIDRYFLGGTSFRGFAPGGIGPRDTFSDGTLDIDSALGGNYYAMVRTQVTFPLGFGDEAGIFGGVFLNAGTVWGLDVTSVPEDPGVRAAFTVDDSAELRASAGVSLFLETPIGPLRLDFATPLVEEDGDVSENFRLGVGRRF
ncbi:MAG: outer membrane protein assembly factor BamA [Rubricella sp.]